MKTIWIFGRSFQLIIPHKVSAVCNEYTCISKSLGAKIGHRLLSRTSTILMFWVIRFVLRRPVLIMVFLLGIWQIFLLKCGSTVRHLRFHSQWLYCLSVNNLVYTIGSQHLLTYRWRSSLWKILWKELLAYTLAFLLVSLIYRVALTEDMQIQAEMLMRWCGKMYTGDIYSYRILLLS